MHLNKYYYKNISRVEDESLKVAPHSTISMRTRVHDYRPNYELIKNCETPLPVLSVKHLHNFADPILANVKYLHDQHLKQANLEKVVAQSFRFRRISREKNVLSSSLKDYIRRKIIKTDVPYFTEKEYFDLNFQRGTLELVDNTKVNFFAYVWNGNEIRFCKAFKKSNPLEQRHSLGKDSPVPIELMVSRGKVPFLGVRYKTYVDIAKLPEKTDITNSAVIKPVEKFEDNCELMASALNDKYLTTINTKEQLNRYNIEYRRDKTSRELSKYFTGKIGPVSIEENTKSTLRSNYLTLTTCNAFSLFDFRTKRQSEMTTIFDNQNHFPLKCEKMLNHKKSLTDTNNVYIVSTHLLYAFDFRNMKKPLAHWAHHLMKPALLMKTEVYGTTEVILVSSHRPGDFRLFNFSPLGLNYLPYKPMTIANTYNRLKEQGLFLLSEDIQQRVEASTAGVALDCDPINKTVKVYAQNVYSDIFEHDLSCDSEKRTQVSDQHLMERFSEWEDFLKVPRNPNKEMTVKQRLQSEELMISDIRRLRGVSKVLSGEKVPIYDITDHEPERNIAPEPAWKININEARQCKDLLATEIMQVWDDIDLEEVRPSIFADAIDASQQEKEQGIDKVSMWLERASREELEADEKMEEECATVNETSIPSSSFVKKEKRKSRVLGF